MQGRRTEEVDGLNSRFGRMVTSTLSSSPPHAGSWCSDLHRWPHISWIGLGNEPRHAIELIPWVKSSRENESEKGKNAILINVTLDPPHISYFPGLLEPRRMAEKALTAVIQEAYVTWHLDTQRR